MRQLVEIADNRDSVSIIVGLTGAFEGIASMRIAQTKDQVKRSSEFFAELWRIYNQIRVDELFHFGRRQSTEQVIKKELMILVTSEGGFSGDIDERLINDALKKYKAPDNDIIIIGHHGLILLQQRNVRPTRSFQLPKRDHSITAAPLIEEVLKYESTTVYYQSYQSLVSQDIKTIKLATAVAERGKNVAAGEEVITESNYIFEPSTFDVVDHLEHSMMQITLSEVILESKLAHYASRFKAMSVAHERADESLHELTWQYMRAKRHAKDERLKETINGLRNAQ
jgi:ATP synthase F1 gamma subunit